MNKINDIKISFKEIYDNRRIRRNLNSFLFKVLQYALVISVGFMIIYPILKMISTAFTDPSALGNPLNFWIPENPSTILIKLSSRILKPDKSLLLSLGYSTILMIIQIISSAVVGYGLAKFDFKGKNLIFAGVILTIVVPPQTMILSQYLNYRYFDFLGMVEFITGDAINLLNNTTAYFLISLSGHGLKSGLFIFIFRQFFKGLPKELEEAASIDGAGHIRTFVQIMLPTTVPAMLTVGVFSFAWNYGDTYFSSLFVQSGTELMALLMN
ncbi:MAG: carbohydrate ABC transporter permease, partial [Turicibacter sp.]